MLSLTMELTSLEQSMNFGSWWRPLMKTELCKKPTNIASLTGSLTLHLPPILIVYLRHWWKVQKSNWSHPQRCRCYWWRASHSYLWCGTIVEFPTINSCQFRSQWPFATHSKPLPCLRNWRTVCPWSTWPWANLQPKKMVPLCVATTRTVLEMVETGVFPQP